MPCSRNFHQIKKKRQQKLMKSGWRWYGADDAISLKEIRQAGVTDVVAALYRRKAGEIWPVEEIKAQADAVRAAGMEWSVVECPYIGSMLRYRPRRRWRPSCV